MGQTYFEKVWTAHRVSKRAAGEDVVFVDRHYVHDLSGGPQRPHPRPRPAC